MHMPMSDKGWLRAHFPQATPDQVYRFLEKVGIKLGHANTLGADVDRARIEAFNELLGLTE